MLVSIALISSALFVANAEVNGTTCSGCTGDVCSTLNSTICYQGNISAANEFNGISLWSTTSEAYCTTCPNSSYTYFLQGVPGYPLVEEWMMDNPLCALKAATNIENLVTQGTLSGWECDGMLPTTNYCDGWTGVSCFNTSAPYPFNTSVGALSLSGIGLIGSLPSQIGNMPYLSVLDVSRNSLASDIPSEIGGLTGAIAVDLSFNDFTSSIPAEFFDMSILVNLTVANNQISGSLPEQVNLAQFLQSLNISSNKMTGTIPEQLCSDVFLTYVNIANNDIECFEQCVLNVPTFIPGDALNCYNEVEVAQGIALCDLYAATNIGELVDQGIMGGWDCNSGTPVTEICSWFGVYCGDEKEGVFDDIVVLNTTVVEMNLGYLGIEGTIPSSLYQLSYLFSLNLAGNSFEGTIPTTISSCTDLLAFTVEDNMLEGSIPNFVEWKNLLEFSVASNSFTGSIPEFVMDLVYLQQVMIQNNKMSGIIPVEMCNASSLHIFDFSYNLFTCYANCLISVPYLINEQNISTCNHVQQAPISQDSIIFIIIGVSCGTALLVIVLLYVFARDKIGWLFGEVHNFMIRMTEEREGLIDDLDFTSLRPSMVSSFEHQNKGDLSSSHFINHSPVKDSEDARNMSSLDDDGQAVGAPIRIPSKKLGAAGKVKAERMSQFNENL